MFQTRNIVNAYTIMSSSELILESSPVDIKELELKPQAIINYLIEKKLVKLEEYILDNLSNLDGGPAVNNLEVVNFKYDQPQQKGRFRLKFQIDRRYCCADMESCVNDYLDFDYRIYQDRLIAKTSYFDWSLNN